ncbi:MAG: hypothetical protein ACI8XO_000021 [Verrucomicrobiales bacterium]
MKKFAPTLEAHSDGVMASWFGITNAVAEGLNRIIRMTKNRASGYRSTDNSADMIYLIADDLNLPGQIPAINRPRITKPLHHKTLCREPFTQLRKPNIAVFCNSNPKTALKRASPRLFTSLFLRKI